MSTLHIFTEEPSIKNVFDIILPKILPQNISFMIHPHQGKQDLERALKTTIPSISKTPGAKILITRDQDNADCKELKKNIKKLLYNKCNCDFFIRIVCRELESWFLGDIAAIEKAFPRFKSQQYARKPEMKVVDLISKPSDYLLRIIPEYTKNKSLPKLELSNKIAPYMNINDNKSDSFNNTIAAIRKLVG